MPAPTIDTAKIATDATAKVVEEGIKSLWGKVKKYFQDLNAKEEIDLKIPFTDYIKRTREKYGFIKTILYNKTPQDLLSIYECLDLKYNRQALISSESVKNITDIGNKILITGTGGLGKSTMLRSFFLKPGDNIPVMLELRTLNSRSGEELSIRNAVYRTMTDFGFTLNDEYYEYSLKKGGYLILLDGFDELSREVRDTVAQSIRSFADKYPENRYIVSSRPSEEFISWNDFIELECQPMTLEQAVSLVSKIKAEDEVKEKFTQELEKTLFEKHESFTSNPLLLTIMFMTFQNHASMPEKLNEFYEQAFMVLFDMHDATKESFKRDIRTGLGANDFKLIFSYICFKSYFADEFEFNDATLNAYIETAQQKFPDIKFQLADFRDDLTKSVCMLVKDGIKYTFSHRSFQEYFAAYYTCKLTDEEQAALLKAFISEHPNYNHLTTGFFPMLFEFQGERLNRLLFLPAFRKFKKVFVLYGFTINLLNEIAGKVFIKLGDYGNEDNGFISIALPINAKYIRMFYTMKLAFKLNGYSSSTTYYTNILPIDELGQDLSSKIKQIISEFRPDRFFTRYSRVLTFKQISQFLTDEEILFFFRSIQDDEKIAQEFIDRYDKPATTAKTLKGILDDL